MIINSNFLLVLIGKSTHHNITDVLSETCPLRKITPDSTVRSVGRSSFRWLGPMLGTKQSF